MNEAVSAFVISDPGYVPVVVSIKEDIVTVDEMTDISVESTLVIVDSNIIVRLVGSIVGSSVGSIVGSTVGSFVTSA